MLQDLRVESVSNSVQNFVGLGWFGLPSPQVVSIRSVITLSEPGGTSLTTGALGLTRRCLSILGVRQQPYYNSWLSGVAHPSDVNSFAFQLRQLRQLTIAMPIPTGVPTLASASPHGRPTVYPDKPKAHFVTSAASRSCIILPFLPVGALNMSFNDGRKLA